VLPREIPNDKWMPMIVPARPLFLVDSSLPYFMPTVVKYPHDAANKPNIMITNHWLPKNLGQMFKKVNI
jgi:hypothetical protein